MCIFGWEQQSRCRNQEINVTSPSFCKKTELYVTYYRRQIKSYNDTLHNNLKKEIDLILPLIPAEQKCGIITTLVSSFIGLIYEGISSFLNILGKRHKA